MMHILTNPWVRIVYACRYQHTKLHPGVCNYEIRGEQAVIVMVNKGYDYEVRNNFS